MSQGGGVHAPAVIFYAQINAVTVCTGADLQAALWAVRKGMQSSVLYQVGNDLA